MDNPQLPLALNFQGDAVAEVQRALRDLQFPIPAQEVETQTFGVGTRTAVMQLQAAAGITRNGVVDTATRVALQSAVGGGDAAQKNSIGGQVWLDRGEPARNLTIRFYGIRFGGEAVSLGEPETDDAGFYSMSYDAPESGFVNIEARFLGGEEEKPLSATRFRAARHEVMNLVVPGSAQPLEAPEYARLGASLEQTMQLRLADLAQARETRDRSRQDITLVHDATGWDGRIVALAATAQQLATAQDAPLLREIGDTALYGVARVGLPTGKEQLAQVTPEAFRQGLEQANKAGIIALKPEQVEEAVGAFTTFASDALLAKAPQGTLSSPREMLAATRLNTDEARVFGDLFVQFGDDPARLWQEARNQGFTDGQVQQLQTQGQLAYLTLNNAPLTAKLQDEFGAPGAFQELVTQRLYAPDEWAARLTALANNDTQQLDKLIPSSYGGDTPEARRDAYAADLARKVRITFPTAVIGQMLLNQELTLPGGHDSAMTGAVLKAAEPLGFRLGRDRVDAFVDAHAAELSPGTPATEIKAALKQTQRLTQITTSNTALQKLAELGFTSAADVVAIPYEQFLLRYGSEFENLDVARLIYRKAEQVSAVTRNFFTIARQVDSAPAVHALSPTPTRRDASRSKLLATFPTLEQLFGELDFCACDHCRSVLSPAAYFVDLLAFLDQRKTWPGTLADWKAKHQQAPYPFETPEQFTRFQADWAENHPGEPAPNTEQSPYDILVDRRPDLPHIPLSCDNTLTAMPHIDLVNEIQEYYVAHEGVLDAGAAHDTAGATSPELLAEPQYIEQGAYDTLKAATFPMSLPFDLWVETVRRMFDHFDTPLWQAMELFRASDALLPPAQNPEPYYRGDIFREALGLAPGTAALLTEPAQVNHRYTLYSYETREAALEALQARPLGSPSPNPTAKTLARLLGVSYQELADLVTTWFINPHLASLITLTKIGLDIDDVLRQRAGALSTSEQSAFDARLDTAAQRYATQGFKPRDWLDEQWATGGFDGILILHSPPGCTFDETHLRFADGAGTPPDDLVFYKLNIFVRLWRALGWTMEETDRALQLFLKTGGQPLDGQTLPAAMQTALVYMSHLDALSRQVATGKDGRQKLMTFWATLPTTGRNPLYAQLFLTRTILHEDAVFDDPLGNYLADSTLLIRDHLPALRQALNLTAAEVALILRDVGLSLDPGVAEDGAAIAAAPLTQENVALLFRYGFLAKGLGVKAPELITLKALAGLNPFAPLDGAPLAAIEADQPFMQTIPFVAMVAEIKASGFTVADLDYLFRHQFDPVGPYRPDPTALIALVKGLAAGLRQIEAQYALPTDPATLTDDILQQQLALLLPPETVATFARMLAGTEEYTAVLENVAEASALKPADFAQFPAIHVDAQSYDPVTQTQRLTYRGVLVDATKAKLLEAFADRPAIGAVLDPLLAGAQTQPRAFFAEHLAFLFPDPAEPAPPEPAAFRLTFTPFAEIDTVPELALAPCADGDLICQAGQQEKVQTAKRTRMAAAFLPAVRATLSRQLVGQTLAAALGADPVLTDTLLADPRLLVEPATGAPLLAAFEGVAARGLSAWFSALPEPAPGDLILADLAPTAATESITTPDPVDPAHAIPPAAINSAQFAGYFEAPEAADYTFVISAPAGSLVELRIGDAADPVIPSTKVALVDGKPQDVAVVVPGLKPGIPYALTFSARKLNNGAARLRVRGSKLPLDAVSQLLLYPDQPVRHVDQARTLLAKALQLIQGLELTEREMRHVTSPAANFGVDLRQLPTTTPPDAASAVTAFTWFRRLAAYVALRAELAGGEDDLIDIFERARLRGGTFLDSEQVTALMLDDLASRVAALARRDAADVRAAMVALRYAAIGQPDGYDAIAELTHERGVRRLWDVLRMVERFGVPVAALAGMKQADGTWRPGWAQPRPDFGVTQELRQTVKARYEPETWQRIAPSIFDPLRQRQRDALVAFILTRLGLDRIEQLFEYFLVDPGMEPVVQTSRLRQAISSVQLFVQRCLLNLEPRVHPSVLNAQHWEWMKRYRVWEANRKIFLYPENWLEPEFRDDKTHLFAELEGALLAGDVSDQLVEDAFFVYLKKLEELAQLEMVSMFAEEQSDPAGNVLHVIGRTPKQPHKYFYRRYVHGAWTPWEPVGAEIEGNHVAAVMWRSRLHLFWVTFLQKPDKAGGAATDTTEVPKLTMAKITSSLAPVSPLQVEVWLNWSDLYQGDWSVREAGALGTGYVTSKSANFDSKNVFIHVSKEVISYVDGSQADGAVSVHLSGDVEVSFRVANKNSPPRITDKVAAPFFPYGHDISDKRATQYPGAGPLTVNFIERSEQDAAGATTEIWSDPTTIFAQGAQFTLLGLNQRLQPAAASADTALTQRLRGENAYVRPLLDPFFYMDDGAVLFAIPELTEETFIEYRGYVTKPKRPDYVWNDPDWWKLIEGQVIQQVPNIPRGPIPFPEPEEFDRINIYQIQATQDLLINPATVLKFDEGMVGRAGSLSLVEIHPEALAGTSLIAIAVAPGSSVTAGTVVAVDPGALTRAGEVLAPGGIGVGGIDTGRVRDVSGITVTSGINVVGANGINAAGITGARFSGAGISAEIVNGLGHP